MSYQHIELRPLGGTLGAEVNGVDLSQPLDEATVKEIRTAWLDYQVLFFRDQDITPDQQKAFAHRFGEFQKPGFVPTLENDPYVKVQEYNQYSQIGSDVTWHADDTFAEIPSKCSVLYAVDVPESGGDTVWANMEAAYDALSKPMQKFLSGLTAMHDLVAIMGPGVLKLRGPDAFTSFYKGTPPVEHPLVRTHPETGRKCIFVNPLMTSYIKDLEPAESKAILTYVFDHIKLPEFQVRFKWQKHSIAFWDNRNTVHKGINDFAPAHRLMHRVAIADTERPH
jgi:taurine dioxygenase